MIIIQATFSDEPTPDLFRGGSDETSISAMEREYFNAMQALHQQFIGRKRELLKEKGYSHVMNRADYDIPTRE